MHIAPVMGEQVTADSYIVLNCEPRSTKRWCSLVAELCITSSNKQLGFILLWETTPQSVKRLQNGYSANVHRCNAMFWLMRRLCSLFFKP